MTRTLPDPTRPRNRGGGIERGGGSTRQAKSLRRVSSNLATRSGPNPGLAPDVKSRYSPAMATTIRFDQRRLSQEIAEVVERIVKADIEEIYADLRKLAPVDTGALRRSIRRVPGAARRIADVAAGRRRSSTTIAIVEVGGPSAPHAPILEFAYDRRHAWIIPYARARARGLSGDAARAAVESGRRVRRVRPVRRVRSSARR